MNTATQTAAQTTATQTIANQAMIAQPTLIRASAVRTVPYMPPWLVQFSSPRQNYLAKNGPYSDTQDNHRITLLTRHCQINIDFLLKITGLSPDSIGPTNEIFTHVIKGDAAIDELIDIITCDDVGGNKYGNLFFAYGVEDYRDLANTPLPSVKVTHHPKQPIKIDELPTKGNGRDMRGRCEYVRQFLIPLARFRVSQALQQTVFTSHDLTKISDQHFVMLDDLKRYLAGFPQQSCVYADINHKMSRHTLLPSRFNPYQAFLSRQ